MQLRCPRAQEPWAVSVCGCRTRRPDARTMSTFEERSGKAGFSVLTQKSMSQLGCRVTPPPLNLCPHVLPSIHDTQPGLVLTHAVPAERWVEPKACTCPWSQKESSVSMQPGRRCPRPLAWGPCPEPGSAGQGHRGFELSPLHEAGVGGPAGPCWAAQTLRTGGFNIKKKIGFHVILLT